jgi:hypothetical protein
VNAEREVDASWEQTRQQAERLGLAGMLLSALGGRIARGQRERAVARTTIPME